MSQGYTVFSIPVGLVYRPNEAKVKNLKSKDYLGKARLVAASDRANAFTGFAGVERLKAEVRRTGLPRRLSDVTITIGIIRTRKFSIIRFLLAHDLFQLFVGHGTRFPKFCIS